MGENGGAGRLAEGGENTPQRAQRLAMAMRWQRERVEARMIDRKRGAEQRRRDAGQEAFKALLRGRSGNEGTNASGPGGGGNAGSGLLQVPQAVQDRHLADRRGEEATHLRRGQVGQVGQVVEQAADRERGERPGQQDGREAKECRQL